MSTTTSNTSQSSHIELSGGPLDGMVVNSSNALATELIVNYYGGKAIYQPIGNGRAQYICG